MLLDPDGWTLAFRAEEVHAGLPSELRERVTLETHAAVMEVATESTAPSAPRWPSSGLRRGGLRAGRSGPARRRGWHASVRVGQRHAAPPRIRATARSATPCACSRAASRRWPPTSTSAWPTPTTRSGCSTACACTCRCCSRCPPTRRSGEAGPPGSRPRARRSSTRSHAPGCRAASAATGTGSQASSGCWARVRSRTPRSSGGTRACSPATAPWRSASWTGRPRSRRWARSPRSCRRWPSVELDRPDDPSAPEASSLELIEENRFLAARDGMHARLIEPREGRRVPAIELLGRVRAACVRHARRLRSERELASICRLVERNGAARQLAHADGDGDLRRVTARLADAYGPRSQPYAAISAAAS